MSDTADFFRVALGSRRATCQKDGYHRNAAVFSLCFLLTAHKQAEGCTYTVSSEAQEPFLLAEYVCIVHLITDILIVTSLFDNPGCVDELPENIYSAQCFREDVIYVRYEMLRSSQPLLFSVT